MSHAKPKIIVVLGPTASGKTKLAVKLANEFNGEIVSADSRQVYKGMDIGTGKDLQDYRLKISNPKSQIPNKFQIQNSKSQNRIKIPYHLIDVADPRRQFNLVKYQKLAFAAIDNILRRGKLPILTGGSGLYLQAVVDNFKLSDSKRDLALRKESEKLNVEELFNKLSKLAPKMAARLNNSDKNNKRRLVRYLEILEQDKDFKSKTGKRKYNALIIGLDAARGILKERIARRLIQRLKEQNLIGEVENLHSQGLGWKRLENFGLEYKFISLYLQKKLSYEEMVEKLNIAINQFSKRQLTWFKRWEKQGVEINWVKNNEGTDEIVRKFLKINKKRADA